MLDFQSPPPLSGALIAGLPIRILPTLPLAWFLQRLAGAFCRLYPQVSQRVSGFSGHRLLLDPTDLPLAFVLVLTDAVPRIDVVAQGRAPETAVNAAVKGSVTDLMALFEGRVDGDALFFSRQLQVTGDMELVVALRNALDDARVDLRTVVRECLGPAAPFGDAVLDLALRGYGRLDSDLSLIARAVASLVHERLARQSAEIERLRGDLGDLRRQLRGARQPWKEGGR